MVWKYVGTFLIGIIIGSGIVYTFDLLKGQTIICTCTETQGGLRWNAECPDLVKNQFQGTCP